MNNILNNVLFKKFLYLKKHPLNKLLQNLDEHDTHLIENCDDKIDTCYYFIYYFYENLKNSVNFLQIKKNIIKENHTNTYFFFSNKYLFFYINEKDIKHFYLKFFFSNVYKFKIYKYANHYICFCISHKKNNIPENFYEEYSLKSLFLSHVLSNYIFDEYKKNCSFIILNNSYNNYINKINNTFHLYSILGKGPTNNDSLLIIDTIKQYIKYNQYTSYHYLITF